MHALTRPALFAAAALLVAVVVGCGQSSTEPTKAEPPSDAVIKTGHNHSGWWCTEHGVPEEICGLCDPDVAAAMQKKGDWCKDHDRPDSQCFVCHPEHEARFAAQYEAKYGEKPPKPAS